tara:strand:+ start:411 stop:665 length:255 start_codon:yes stop_codon:yes gene_type:complete
MKLIRTKSSKKINYNLILIVFIIIYLFYTNQQIKSTDSKVNMAIGIAAEAQETAENAQNQASNAQYDAEDARETAERALYYSRY